MTCVIPASTEPCTFCSSLLLLKGHKFHNGNTVPTSNVCTAGTLLLLTVWNYATCQN
jgi:hypothetical protein